MKVRDPTEVSPTAADLAESLKERSSTEVSLWTIQRRLYEHQLKKVVKTKKPFVSPANRRKRVEFPRRYRHLTVEQWEKVLWSDESPFVIRCQNHQYVWRSPNEKFSPRCLQGTVKHQKKIMVWGCFSWYGVGALHRIEGILKKGQYRQILIHQMRPSARRRHGNNFIFQHDNDPKHTSNAVKSYLRNQCIKGVPWPPQSPDFNPIENLWSEIDRQLHKRQVNGEEKLFKCLEEKWENFSKQHLQNLVESMPNRCAKVVKSRGYPIDY